MNSPAYPGSSISKLQALKNSAKSFVDSFNESTDRFALIKFSSSATVLYKVTDPFVKADLKSKIDSLTAGSWTSMQAGFVYGRKQGIAAKLLTPPRKPVIVIITDGAPTYNMVENEPSNPDTPVYPSALRSCINAVGGSDAHDYLYALAEHDLVLNDGILVYSIGVGNEDPVKTSAFQTIGNADLLKDIFLKNAANDFAKGRNNLTFPCVNTFTRNNGRPTGEYLQTPDALELTYLFSRVQRSILARINQ